MNGWFVGWTIIVVNISVVVVVVTILRIEDVVIGDRTTA